MQRHLLDHGLTPQDMHWFIEHGRSAAPHCIVGLDYYGTNEQVMHDGGRQESQGLMLGWHAIARDYYQRYQRPMMLTETNANDLGYGEAARWLKQIWSQAHHLRHQGVPMVGFTWFSLTDQVDWDIQLVQVRGRITPNGLCTLERTLRDVGRLYQQIAHDNMHAPLIQGVPTGLLAR